MGSKDQALIELNGIIKEFNLKRTNVGMAIAGNKSFMDLMEDESKAITTSTLDKVNRYVLEFRGQQDLPLEK